MCRQQFADRRNALERFGGHLGSACCVGPVLHARSAIAPPRSNGSGRACVQLRCTARPAVNGCDPVDRDSIAPVAGVRAAIRAGTELQALACRLKGQQGMAVTKAAAEIKYNMSEALAAAPSAEG